MTDSIEVLKQEALKAIRSELNYGSPTKVFLDKHPEMFEFLVDNGADPIKFPTHAADFFRSHPTKVFKNQTQVLFAALSVDSSGDLNKIRDDLAKKDNKFAIEVIDLGNQKELPYQLMEQVKHDDFFFKIRKNTFDDNKKALEIFFKNYDPDDPKTTQGLEIDNNAIPDLLEALPDHTNVDFETYRKRVLEPIQNVFYDTDSYKLFDRFKDSRYFPSNSFHYMLNIRPEFIKDDSRVTRFLMEKNDKEYALMFRATPMANNFDVAMRFVSRSPRMLRFFSLKKADATGKTLGQKLSDYIEKNPETAQTVSSVYDLDQIYKLSPELANSFFNHSDWFAKERNVFKTATSMGQLFKQAEFVKDNVGSFDSFLGEKFNESIRNGNLEFQDDLTARTDLENILKSYNLSNKTISMLSRYPALKQTCKSAIMMRKLLPAMDFWKDWESDVKPEHFAIARAAMTGQHHTVNWYRSDENITAHSADSEDLWPRLRKWGKLSQRAIVAAAPHPERPSPLSDSTIQLRGEGENTEILLHRGIGGHFAKQVADSGTLPVAPIQSWTTHLPVAKGFADYRRGLGGDDTAITVSHWFPLKNVLHYSNFSYRPYRGRSPSEHEVVIYHNEDSIVPENISNVERSDNSSLNTLLNQPQLTLDSLLKAHETLKPVPKPLKKAISDDDVVRAIYNENDEFLADYIENNGISEFCEKYYTAVKNAESVVSLGEKTIKAIEEKNSKHDSSTVLIDIFADSFFPIDTNNRKRIINSFYRSGHYYIPQSSIGGVLINISEIFNKDYKSAQKLFNYYDTEFILDNIEKLGITDSRYLEDYTLNTMIKWNLNPNIIKQDERAIECIKDQKRLDYFRSTPMSKNEEVFNRTAIMSPWALGLFHRRETVTDEDGNVHKTGEFLNTILPPQLSPRGIESPAPFEIAKQYPETKNALLTYNYFPTDFVPIIDSSKADSFTPRPSEFYGNASEEFLADFLSKNPKHRFAEEKNLIHFLSMSKSDAIRDYLKKEKPELEKTLPVILNEKAKQFWHDWENNVKPKHFATIQAATTGQHTTVTARGETVDSQGTEDLWPELKSWADVSQKALLLASKMNKRIKLRKRNGQIEVYAHRGLGGQYAEDTLNRHKNKTPHDVAPIQSWTLDRNVAHAFARYRTQNGRVDNNNTRATVSAWIPIKNIVHFAAFNTEGFKSRNHKEMEIVAHSPQQQAHFHSVKPSIQPKGSGICSKWKTPTLDARDIAAINPDEFDAPEVKKSTKKSKIPSIKVFFAPMENEHMPKFEMNSMHKKRYEETKERSDSILKALKGDARFEIVEPSKKSPLELVKKIHSKDYLQFLQETSSLKPGEEIIPDVTGDRQSAGFDKLPIRIRAGAFVYDDGAPFTKYTWESALAAATCARDAALAVSHGEPVAYALCRPPGHHAEHDRAGGFCYLCNAAIAAAAIADKRIVVLDLDYHYGQGTDNCIHLAAENACYISLHGDPCKVYPYFSGSKDTQQTDNSYYFRISRPLPPKCGIDKYIKTLKEAITLVQKNQPEVLIVSLGLDTMKGDPEGDFGLTVEDIEKVAQTVRSLLPIPTVIVQEGGYNIKNLHEGVKAFLTQYSDQMSKAHHPAIPDQDHPEVELQHIVDGEVMPGLAKAKRVQHPTLGTVYAKVSQPHENYHNDFASAGIDWSPHHNEAIAHRLARHVFGLGSNVPPTSVHLFADGTHATVTTAVPFDSTVYAPPEISNKMIGNKNDAFPNQRRHELEKKILSEKGEFGESVYDRALVFDSVLATPDRHAGNTSLHPCGHFALIDHGLSLMNNGNYEARVPAYLQGCNHAVNMDALVRFTNSITHEKLRQHLANEPAHISQMAIERLEAFKKRLMKIKHMKNMSYDELGEHVMQHISHRNDDFYTLFNN